MSLCYRIFLLFSLSALAILAACGGGGSKPIIPSPPPTGGFSNTNLNGTYVFSVSGANGNGVFAMAGSFDACGCSQGTISSGTVDIADPLGAQPGLALLGGSAYQISPDGRGILKLLFNTATLSNYEIDLDFVLTSSSHGLLTRYDQNGTGSGTLDLQDASVSQSQLTNNFYAYSLSGGDINNKSLASIGEFQPDGTGNLVFGYADFNYAALPYSQLLLSGSVVLGSGTTPGTASLQTTFSTTPLGFDVFAIDSTHLKLIENDGQFILVGDVLSSPTNTFPAGNLAFNVAGLDSANLFFVGGGVMASDGISAISSGFEDVNDNGVVDNGTSPATPFNISGFFTETPANSGRWAVTMTGFFGGTQFVAYPINGGLLMLEADAGTGVTGGVALQQQSGVTDLASQGYGLNLTGADISIAPPVETDQIAEFKANAGNLTGTVDINDGGSLLTNALTGTYGSSPVGAFTGTGSATMTAGFGGMFYYLVDSSTALFISSDSVIPGSGSMEAQATPAKAALSSIHAPRALPMFRVIPHGKMVAGKHGKAATGKK